MDKQIEFQRNVIREEYIKEKDIDERLKAGDTIRPLTTNIQSGRNAKYIKTNAFSCSK